MSATGRDGQNEISIRGFLIERVAEHCHLTPGMVDPDRPLADLGLASRDAVALMGELEELLDRSLPAALPYEHPTITRLARVLARSPHGPRDLSPGARLDSRTEVVAVVGLGCRFPGGIEGPEAFWRFLLDEGDAIAQVPEDRREDVEDVGGPAGRLGGFLGDIAGFDSRFFQIRSAEADAMDPQQRLLLEVSWEAFEHAGIAPASLRGSRSGVFVGISSPEYGLLTMAQEPSVWTATGAALSIAANRLSYQLDLRGPSMSVDTACSSSLVATHLAVRSLREGQIDLAVAGGVNVVLSALISMSFDLAGGSAPDGRCKAFDASADGMVRAEGCGVVVLKRLGDARRDGDRVLAVITNTAVNSDGHSNGLPAPNPGAQEALLREVYAGLEPPDYVEAHGTGTLLGDPIEAHALGAVLGRVRGTPLLVGSVKTNLGHLEAAAGAAGLIKTVLALWHQAIPASLHYRRPNPYIDFAGLGLEVVAHQTPWPPGPARAGVSGFGFGGTNAHMALEQAPPAPPVARRPDPVHTLLLSDVSADRVREYAGRLADDLADLADLAGVEHTLARRYGRGPCGAAVVGRSREALAAGLRALRDGSAHPAVVTGVSAAASAPVWVFSGYGAQRPGMARRLLAEEPSFATAIELLEPLVEAEAGFSLWHMLGGDRPGSAGTPSPHPDPDPAQTMVTLFAVQVGLARLWQAYGVEPAAVIGHSMGEVAAAVVAGALTPGEAVTIISCRADLLTSIVGGGTMAAIGASGGEAAELGSDCRDVHVAVRSSPRQTVVTGDAEQIATVMRRAERRGLLARIVAAEGAGHSPQVEPLLAPLRERLAQIRSTMPRIPFYSTVLEDPRRIPVFDAHYWAANLRGTVRFVDAVRAAAEDGHRAFVEISAHPLLAHALAETVEDSLVLPTLRGSRGTDEEEADDTVTFHAQLAALKLGGLPIGLPTSGQIIDLPRPPWRHTRHWTRARRTSRAQTHPLLGAHVEVPEEQRHLWTANVGQDALAWLPLHGVTVLPAAAYAEIALAAGAQALAMGALAVTDLRVQRPLLPLDEHTTITTSFTVTRQGRRARGGRVEVRTRTPAGNWTPLATATVIPAADMPVTTHDYSGGRVRVAPAERGDPRFTLHPVVLDRALAVFGAGWTTTAIGALRVLGPTHGGGCCELGDVRERDGTAVAALRLVTDTGQVLLEADDVIARHMPRTIVPVPLSATLLEATWNQAPPTAPPPGGTDPARWVVLGHFGDTGAEVLAAGLTAAGQRVTRYHCSTWDPTWGGLGEISSPAPGAGPADMVVMVPPRLVDEKLVLALSDLIRILPPVRRLWIITRRAIPVRPGEAGEPGQAFLRALTRVLGFEHPALRATLVDTDDPAAPAAELLLDGADTEVAWRGGVRYVARLRAARLGAGPPLEVVEHGGAYAISGGYGGLGLVTARRLAERGAGRLVLCGRSGPGAEAQQIIGGLRDAGTEVEIVLGDIARPGVAERVVAAARSGGRRLCGVVHAAGTLADRMVTDLGPRDLRRVWSPKVDGALRLHEATRELDLDWWVVYSSAAALLGSPGQAAYAAANARADTLVDWRRAHGLPAATIHWGPWAEVGGAAGLAARVAGGILDPLTAQEGADALEALLAYDRAATGVLRFDPVRALTAFPEMARWPYFSALVAGAAAGGASGDSWPGPEGLGAADPGTVGRLVRVQLSRRVSAVLGFNPDPMRPLTELGLDSLVAVRLRSAIEHDFGVTVPSSFLLRGVSLTALQAEVLRLLGHAQELSPAGAPPEAAPASPIVRLLPGGVPRQAAGRPVPGPRPFFCAHPAGGGTGVYRQLAALLGEDTGFYGLERFEDAPEVTERAARYLRLIGEVQPRGPYRLGGWSFGGVLAYEMARQLGAGEVEFVAMIDAGLPRRVENLTETAARRYADFGRYLAATYHTPVALPFEELAALEEDQQLALVIERTRPVMAHLPPAVARHQFTSHQDTRSLERYDPGRYDGHVVLYRSTEPTPWTVHDARYDLDAANGFGELCPQLEIIPVPGTHHLNLLDPPGVQVIADHLRGLLGGSARRAPEGSEPG